MNLQALWSGLDWLIIVAYFIGILLIGVAMRKRAGKSVKSFYVASRKLTVPILIGIGAAGWYDSWTIVGLAECGWTMGLCTLLIFVVPEGVLRLPLATIIGPHVRDRIPDWVVTVPDMMKYLYSDKVRLVSAVTYIANLLYDSALLFAIADVMHMVSGLSMIATLIIVGVVIVAYTALSGLWGLAVTDLIQFAIMTVAAGSLMVGIIVKFGGFPVVWERVAEINPELLTPTGGVPFWEAIAWIISACAMYCEGACYQRFGSARSGNDIKTAYSIMLAAGTSFSTAMLFSGLAAVAFFSDVTSNPAEGFWSMVFTVLPIGFRGLFVAALCAAVMSTVSSDWLLFATCAVNDIYRGFINKGLSEKKTLFGMRIMVGVFGALCVVGTMFWADGIANAWYYLGGFLFSMFFVPIVAGLFYKKKTAQGGLACIVTSAILYVVWEFILACPGGLPSSVVVAVVGAIVYFSVSVATYKDDDSIGTGSMTEV